MNPLVCICIPNYNNEVTLGSTLESLVAQSYDNVIIKVVDNNSSDSSVEIVREFSALYPNVELCSYAETVSGEQNFNRCLDIAEGDFVAVFHSDDVYHEDIIKEQVRVLERDPKAVGVSVAANVIDSTGKVVDSLYTPGFIGKESFNFDQVRLFKEALKHGNFIVCPSVLMRLKVVKENALCWNEEGFKHSSDLDLWLKLSGFGCFYYLNKKLINYRISEHSFSYHANRSYIQQHDIISVFEFYLDLLSEQLSFFDRLNFRFFKFRDQVSRVKNRLISGVKISLSDVEFSLLFLLCCTDARRSKYVFFYILMLVSPKLSLFFLSKL
ncbi:glycosyltransferase family 2 protein [Neptuniibacter pectenicola]|jgi:glycosyltransferase involved in cell wall biosynthesis|uniref:glycosyltransferase family 2 protein n=1 Tax=Neptuniibacter pectenicola TaxID=1806669 RepID=UPI0030EDA67A|tara:strand:+ start:1523 stop:2500 length:978 start_codon:yes stop_codon:yes gene_type:complete